MIALMTTSGMPVAIEPDLIESVEAIEGRGAPCCLVRTTSGKEHVIERSYAYVTGVLRKHYAPPPTARTPDEM
jgi:hypothetical protein